MRSLRGRGLRKTITTAAPLLDILCLPATAIAALHLRLVRELGVEQLARCRSALTRIGVFPVRAHYYEPLFDTSRLTGLDQARRLKAVALDEAEQLSRLRTLGYAPELRNIPWYGARPGHFAYDNGNFGPGDAEILYALVRSRNPRRIVEVGSGFSTLVVKAALEMNVREHHATCHHVCIEPYEMPWLESTGAHVLRCRVEDVDTSLFAELGSGDILFIDSSHMIRPQGDVLHLFNHVLPCLNRGVLVHVHDIFTPYDYPSRWLQDKVCFWNEQYILEAFLAYNTAFRVHLALHFLYREHRSALYAACPVLAEMKTPEPKSFWLERA
jgi:predicted O-methyltransferase YrrM